MKIKLKTYGGETIKDVKEARVFFNKDCMKYGIEVYGNLWNDNMGDRWIMIALDTKKPYTHYKSVAKRWLKSIIVEK